MVALRQIEVVFYRNISRQQRGRGLDALAQGSGRTAILFLRNYIVPAAKGEGTDLFEFAVPEIAEDVSGRKNFKTAAQSVGRKILRKQLGKGEGSRRRRGSRRKGAVGGREGGSRKKTAGRVIPTKSTKQINRSRRGIYKRFSLIMSSNFWY